MSQDLCKPSIISTKHQCLPLCSHKLVPKQMQALHIRTHSGLT